MTEKQEEKSDVSTTTRTSSELSRAEEMLGSHIARFVGKMMCNSLSINPDREAFNRAGELLAIVELLKSADNSVDVKAAIWVAMRQLTHRPADRPGDEVWIGTAKAGAKFLLALSAQDSASNRNASGLLRDFQKLAGMAEVRASALSDEQ